MSAALILPVPAAEGVGDALVGGIGLAVDAVGVDLGQDDDAVPGTTSPALPAASSSGAMAVLKRRRPEYFRS
jgi:hypothetical protein